MKSSFRIAIVTFVLAAQGSAAHADFTRFLSATDGFREASATINLTGTVLTIRLSNSASTDVMVPVDILTAMFFDLPAGVVATPVSAVIPDWSQTEDNNWHFDRFFGDAFTPATTNNMGGEWAFLGELSGAPGGLAMGISSTGLDDTFGPSDLFGGPPLDPPHSPNGLNFGITSAGDDLTTGNGQVTGDVPLIRHEMLFAFTVNQSFSWDPNQQVIFQYGTSRGDPTIIVPAPGAALLGLLGLSAAGWMRRRFA